MSEVWLSIFHLSWGRQGTEIATPLNGGSTRIKCGRQGIGLTKKGSAFTELSSAERVGFEPASP